MASIIKFTRSCGYLQFGKPLKGFESEKLSVKFKLVITLYNVNGIIYQKISACLGLLLVGTTRAYIKGGISYNIISDSAVGH